MKLVATLLVRNEAELVADCLEHHLQEGVEAFLVTDHGSTDRLAEVLHSYRRVIHHVQTETEKSYCQDKWVTQMARRATELRPDWIFHLDADERWTGLHLLKQIPEKYAWIKTGAWRNHLPVTATLPGSFHPRMMPYFEIPGRTGLHRPRFVAFGSGTGGKVLHRPMPDVQIGIGNHCLHAPDLPMLSCDGIEVHHFPIRSFQQFRQKVQTGAAAIDAAAWASGVAAHWRKWRDMDNQGQLENLFRSFLLTEEEIRGRLADGTLFLSPLCSR